MERNQEPNRKYNFFLPEGEWVQLSDLDIVWLGAQLHQILHIYSFNPIKAGGSGSMYSLGGASHAPPPFRKRPYRIGIGLKYPIFQGQLIKKKLFR